MITFLVVFVVVAIVASLGLGVWYGRRIATETNDLLKASVDVINNIGTYANRAQNELHLAALRATTAAKADVNGIQQHVTGELMTVLRHVSEQGDKTRTAVVSHVGTAVHSALSDVKKAQHMTCATCNKLSADWKFVEGKIECADCTIRKAL